MKRIAAISISVVLSVVIIALGAGISFVRCCHSRTMELAQFSHEVAHHGSGSDGECCGHHGRRYEGGPVIGAPDCMETVVVKLEPGVTDTQQHPVFHTPCFALQLPAGIAGLCPAPAWLSPCLNHAADAPHSPPRSYLRMIKVLLI